MSLTKLLQGLGLDDKLPEIPTVKRIEVMPVTVSVPVSRATAPECVCPACRTFEKAVDAELCPRCTRQGDIRQMSADEKQRYYDSIDRELAERKRSGMTVHSSPFEPPTVVDTLYQDPDETDE